MVLIDMAIFRLFFDYLKSINQTTYDISPLDVSRTKAKTFFYVSINKFQGHSMTIFSVGSGIGATGSGVGCNC